MAAKPDARPIVVDGLCVEVTRKRVRRVNLRVRPDGTVAVSAPPRVPLSQIERFVRLKRPWIGRRGETARQGGRGGQMAGGSRPPVLLGCRHPAHGRGRERAGQGPCEAFGRRMHAVRDSCGGPLPRRALERGPTAGAPLAGRQGPRGSRTTAGAPRGHHGRCALGPMRAPYEDALGLLQCAVAKDNAQRATLRASAHLPRVRCGPRALPSAGAQPQRPFPRTDGTLLPRLAPSALMASHPPTG